jgi:hypothetical protein
MFFLIGVRTKAKAVGQLERACTKCARSTMQTSIESRRWLTLFLIPIIPLGGPEGKVRCNLCGLNTKATGDMKAQSLPKAIGAKA